MLAEWLSQGPWPIDGGLAYQLEQMGYDLNSRLWTARLLKDDPEAIRTCHESYVDAGARVLITASYQASRDLIIQEWPELNQEAADLLIASSVTIAKKAITGCSRKVWIAASVGPYGATLYGGQEYVGNYGISHSELVKFHRQRMRVLASGDPDLFACETIPDIAEVAALLEALSEWPEIPAWISMSCKDGEHTCAGQSILDLIDYIDTNPQIVAIGVNCTSPEYVTPLLRSLRERTSKPFVVYPNAGRVWNGERRVWVGETQNEHLSSVAVAQWVSLGAKLIGGCCGLGPLTIRQLARDLSQLVHDSLGILYLKSSLPCRPPVVPHV